MTFSMFANKRLYKPTRKKIRQLKSNLYGLKERTSEIISNKTFLAFNINRAGQGWDVPFSPWQVARFGN